MDHASVRLTPIRYKWHSMQLDNAIGVFTQYSNTSQFNPPERSLASFTCLDAGNKKSFTNFWRSEKYYHIKIQDSMQPQYPA